MNGIRIRPLLVSTCVSLCFLSCLQTEKFVQPVFVYEPHGALETISVLKSRTSDKIIEDDVYVQGIVTSSDAEGNYAQKLFFQDETGGICMSADLGSSNQLFPVGQKVSVQCKGMMLADINGITMLSASVRGDGSSKAAVPVTNRTVRNAMFAIDDGQDILPEKKTLAELDKSSDCCLVTVKDVFFQTCELPFANEGGSSEQFRTLFDNSGRSVLLCTSDASTMSGKILPSGKGEVTGVLTFPSGKPVIMVRTEDDIVFHPSADIVANDPEDKVSDIIISEYYSNNGAYYIEVFNSGTETVSLGEYSLASDQRSDSEFSKILNLDDKPLGPFGMVVFANTPARELFADKPLRWDPYRTNYSELNLDVLELDGDSQVALMKDGVIVDLLSSTDKPGWAANKTLIRRKGIKAHSKSNDFTRADAGWITKVAGYAYNLGEHRYLDTDPDFDSPAVTVRKTILDIRNMPCGRIEGHFTIVGRVTSDRATKNVSSNRLFMQDGSNRGICVEFKEGQAHEFNPGDEVSIKLYGSELVSENGLLVLEDCLISRTDLTGAPNEMPAPVEASVSQIINLQSMYILIKNVQVSSSDLESTYGAGNVRSEDLFANEFYIKSTEQSEFAQDKVTGNSGSIAGIAGVYDDRLLIMPRNGGDLMGMKEERFVPIVAEPVTVASLKTHGDGVIGEEIRVTVSVTSDNSEGNMPGKKIFVQDENDGFELVLPFENKFDFGQTLIVVLTRATVSSAGGFAVTPESKTSVVAIGSPDPSIMPKTIMPSQIKNNLSKLVTISNVEVAEPDRLKKFSGSIVFNGKGISAPIRVVTEETATWKGAYIPTATGAVTGLVTKEGDDYVLYPRKYEDLSAIPSDGTRINGEKVVYFVPSDNPKADLFISETVMGDMDANGNLLASVARNKCNAKFVELFNPTGKDIVLSDYRVSCIKYNNSVARSEISYYQFPEGLVLAPGKTVVFKYVSCALGSSTTSFMTNTLWPKGYAGDAKLTSGTKVDTEAVPGVILVLDARDYAKSIANSVASFPAFDGNDILVVQKTSDNGVTWQEIDRVFSLPTADGKFTGKVTYPFLKGYCRKPGVLGTPGNIIDVQDADYTALENKRNRNDFESVQCNPVSGGAANWIAGSIGDVDDLGVHSFSIR